MLTTKYQLHDYLVVSIKVIGKFNNLLLLILKNHFKSYLYLK